jgi:YidC/Oxa1 family membrane protein insertase
MSIFSSVVDAAHSALELLTAVLTPIAGSFATALAIIVFTLFVRLMISPLTYLQVRAERRRAALAPDLAALRAKFPDDPVRLATETIAMQRAAGVGPFVSLLPGLAQALFFMVMFRLAGGVLAGTVFGVPLAAHLFAGRPVFAALIALAVILAWWSSRRMRRAAPDITAGPVGRILPLLPFLTAAAVAYLPLAGGIYLVTSTMWTALEHGIWRRSSPTLTKL